MVAKTIINMKTVALFDKNLKEVEKYLPNNEWGEINKLNPARKQAKTLPEWAEYIRDLEKALKESNTYLVQYSSFKFQGSTGKQNYQEENVNYQIGINSELLTNKQESTCNTCKSGLIDYPEIHRRTCRCGKLGYNVEE